MSHSHRRYHTLPGSPITRSKSKMSEPLTTDWFAFDLLTIERLRTLVRQAFSYGILHAFIVIQWTVTHSSVNHNENTPFPVWKCTPYGSPQPPNDVRNASHLEDVSVTKTIVWCQTINLKIHLFHCLKNYSSSKRVTRSKLHQK